MDNISTFDESMKGYVDKSTAQKMFQDCQIEPIFNQQTPKVEKENFNVPNLNQYCDLIEIYARFNPYLELAGLAANQLSVQGSRFMVNACVVYHNLGWIFAINPEIIGESGSVNNRREGCLTWQNRSVLACRRDGITVKYQTVEGIEKIESFTGFTAQVWQHEINHLNGVEEKVIDTELIKGVKPNEICPCGSGKKFKKCCGRYV